MIRRVLTDWKREGIDVAWPIHRFRVNQVQSTPIPLDLFFRSIERTRVADNQWTQSIRCNRHTFDAVGRFDALDERNLK
jgi:hypothetical protein